MSLLDFINLTIKEMKKNLLFTLATFMLMTSIGFGQAKFKEYVWEEVGLKFSIPNFVKVNSKDTFGIEMESEDFLIYIDLKDDFDDLENLCMILTKTV